MNKGIENLCNNNPSASNTNLLARINSPSTPNTNPLAPNTNSLAPNANLVPT